MKKILPEPVAAPCRFYRPGPWAGWRALLFFAMLSLTGVLRAEVAFSGIGVAQGSGIEIQATQLLDRSPDYGFVPVRISIRNDSGKPRTWNFNFKSEITDNGGFILNNPQSIEVEDGKTKTVDLLVPLPGIGSRNRPDSLMLNVSGYGIEYPMAQLSGPWANDPTAPIGFSQKLFTNLEGPLAASVKIKGYPFLNRSEAFGSHRAESVNPGSTDRRLLSTSLNFQTLPADWRSYSSLGKIVVSEEEWADLPKAQEQAIHDWMALGGRLVVVVRDKPENSVSTGFGGRTDLPDTGQTALIGELTDEIVKMDADPVIPWSTDFFNNWGLNTEVGKLKVNTGLIICFVVVFGIIVAPINLFFFAPNRHRHRLFWTVPLISVVGSILLAGVIILQDGFGGTGVRLAVVMLLPEDHKMAVVQEQITRTALLLGQRFPLSSKTLFAAIPVHSAGVPDGTVFRQEDAAGGDWFSSRTVKAYQLKTVLPTRARVEILGRGADGAPTVQSSLPATLKDFNLIDKDGKVWGLPELKTGERQVLQWKGDDFNGLKEVLEARASLNMKQLVMSAMKRPGYFYALASSGGEVPIATLDSIRWQDDAVIYLGAWTEVTP